ncbi:MAG: tetratricopeptide repeat protein [Planctomycetota bacterium]
MIGQHLGGYELLERLGSGAMGTVYLAAREGEQAAIKVLHPHLLGESGHFKRFVQETITGLRVSHANVVKTIDGDMDVVDGEPSCFIVMEYVKGRTVGSLLDEVGPFPEALVIEIARQVAMGLEAIHEEKIVHRDLKPENILITDDEVVKLMDLGIAQFDDAGLRHSRTGDFKGTVPYAAPEQIRSRKLDGRADLFSLGIVLYEITTGIHPFHAEDIAGFIHGILHSTPVRLSAARSGVTPRLDAAVHRLLARKPEDRFASAKAFLAALEARCPGPILETEPLLHRRPALARETGVRGRHAELERLAELYRDVKKGRGHVVLVEGEVGSGKTRLVDEFVARRREVGDDPDFLFGIYPPGGAAAGLEAFARSLLDRLQDDVLSDALARLLADAPALVAPFAATLRGEPGGLAAGSAGRDPLHAAFCRCFQALAAERPLILLIDDLQFAPEDGFALFAAIACAVPEHPILLIGTMRSRPEGSWHEDLDRLEHVETIDLKRLPEYEVNRLLEDAVGPATLDGRLAARIAEEAQGNPFFLFEILRDLKERKILERREDGTWKSRGRPDDVTVPPTVRHIVAARLAVLDREDRDLLELAGCLGYEFDPLVVADALDMPRIRALRQLTQAQRRHGLVRAVGRRFAFDHHQIREVLYEDVTPLLREEYHALLADTLERAAGAPPEEITGALAADLCEHWLRAQQPAKAAPFVRAAIEHLRGAYHHERAITIAEGVLAEDGLIEGGERVELLVELSELLETGGSWERMREVLDEARDDADATGNDALRARIRVNAGSLAGKLGEVDAARTVLERAAALAADAGDLDVEAKAWNELGNVAADTGDPDRAGECYERSMELARKAGNRKAEASSNGNLGILAMQRGDLAKASELCEQSSTVFREIGERRGEASMLGVLGLIAGNQGDSGKASDLHRQQLDVCRAIGYRRGESIASQNLGDAMRSDGQWVEARRFLERSREISVELNDPAGVAHAQSSIGAALMDIGHREEAIRVYRDALDRSRAIGSKQVEATCLTNLATLEDWVGKPDGGRETAREALACCEDGGDALGAAWAHLVLGRIELSRGDADAARRHVLRAIEVGYPEPRLLGAAYLVRLGGDADPVVAMLTSEADSLSRLHQIEAWLALWKGAGRPEHLARAVEALESLEENMSEGNRGRLRKGVPYIKEVLDASDSDAGGD